MPESKRQTPESYADWDEVFPPSPKPLLATQKSPQPKVKLTRPERSSKKAPTSTTTPTTTTPTTITPTTITPTTTTPAAMATMTAPMVPVPVVAATVKPMKAKQIRPSGRMAKLKGLSLRQPWAELVMNGEKTEEFRAIPTKHRERIYIYASLGRLPADEEASLAEEFELDFESLPRGVVVGTVEIAGCEKQPEGDYGWFLENPQRLDPPVPPIERPQPIWFHPFGSPD